MDLRAGVVAFGQWAVRKDRVRASSVTPGGGSLLLGKEGAYSKLYAGRAG